MKSYVMYITRHIDFIIVFKIWRLRNQNPGKRAINSLGVI